MYHYLRGSREYPLREVPERTPTEIRGELTSLRARIRSAQAGLKAAEAKRDSLLPAIENDGGEERGHIRDLETALTEYEAAKDVLAALGDQADALCEELEDVLYFLRGGVA